MLGQLLTNILLIGSVYALVSLGFTLIFGVGGVLNFSHGAMITAGAFAGYLTTSAGISVWVAVLVAMIVPAALSAGIYLTVVRPVESHVTIMILTLIVALFIENVFRIYITLDTISIPQFAAGEISLGFVSLQTNSVFIIIGSLVAALGTFTFVRSTKEGKALLAMSMSNKGAALVGIPAERINLITWTVAGGLAGIAGVFIASFFGGAWNMGVENLVLAFSIVILGGIGSVKGSIVAAYIIGAVETITTSLISSQMTGLFPLLILIAVLVVNPTGIYGREVES